MRLLFDQNLSFRLCSELADLFPGSQQVGRMGLAEADDIHVWEAARAGGFVLVSQDADFAEMALHRGPLPKVIWLRCGNRSTAYIVGLLRKRADTILAFEQDPDAVCLEIY